MTSFWYSRCTPLAARMSQTRLLWASAMLGERMGNACMAALVGQARAELQRFSVGDLTLMLWSLCIAQVC